MAYDLEEQESIDQMKAWWEKWGTPITTVVTIGCLAFAGWNAWQWYQREQAVKAQGLYAQLANATMTGEMANVTSLSQGLIKDYSGTVFATLGALQAAQSEADNGKLDEAERSLLWVMDKSDYPEYRTIAAVRLAGVYLQAKRYDDGIKVLQGVKPNENEVVMVQDRLGDLYDAKGDLTQARAAWEKALAAAKPNTPIAYLVNLKLGAMPAQVK